MECLVCPLMRKVQSEVPEPEVLATGKDAGGGYGGRVCFYKSKLSFVKDPQCGPPGVNLRSTSLL